MKKLALLLLWLGTLAGQVATAPAFSAGSGTFVNAFTNGTFGGLTFITVADIYGNGRPALIDAAGTGYALNVLTNNGSGGFALRGTIAVGDDPGDVVAATNIDGSGRVDLLCANEGNDTVSVLTNNGLGAFALSQNIPLKQNSATYNLVMADIFNNGRAAVITASGDFDTLTVYTNNGSGIFASNATYTTTFQYSGTAFLLTAADVNGDGWVDLICASYNDSTVTVFTNTGHGTFVTSDHLSLKSGSQPINLTVADIYNNGKPALITANNSLNTLTVLTNAGGGIFGSNATCNVGTAPQSVTAADVNGDGFVDLICASYASGPLIILTNNGSGAFAPASTNNVAFHPGPVVAGNILGHGQTDLLTTGDYGLAVLTNSPAAYQRAFTAGKATNLVVSAAGSPTPAFATTSPLPGGVTLIDHGNGTATLGGTPLSGSGGVYNISLTASNTSGITSQTVTLTVGQPPVFPGCDFVTAATIPVNLNSGQFTVGDLFGTGLPAVITPYTTSGNGLTILTNAGGGILGSNATCLAPYALSAVLTADLYGTGHPALIGVDSTAGTLFVLTNNGSGVFGLNDTINVGATGLTVTTADIFGSGKLALITADYGTSTLSVFTNNGVTFQPAPPCGVGSGPQSLVAADLNGDGHVDLVCANYTSSTLTVLTNNGSGTFLTSQLIPLPNALHPSSLNVADIYNNGKPALIAGSSYDATLLVLTNAGGGIFGSNATYQFYPTVVQTADVNNNGCVDILCADAQSGELTVLTNNGAGRFAVANPRPYPIGFSTPPQDFVAADLNGDGRVDVVTAGADGRAQLTVYTNGAIVNAACTEGTALPPLTPALASGWPAPALSSVTGLLPDGVTFAGGILSGTPQPDTAGNYNLYLTETNALGTSTETIALSIYNVLITASYTLYTDQNTPATITTNTLLADDSDLAHYAFSLTGVSPASTQGGTIAYHAAAGTLTYTPATNYTGADTFTYTLTDTAGDTNQGTVTVTVYPPPVAGTTLFSTRQNTPLLISESALLKNDRDPAGQPLSLTNLALHSTSGGTVAIGQPADTVPPTLTYAPAANFTGLDTFTYTLTDTLGGTATGTVQVIVTAPGSPSYNTAAITPASASQLTLQYTGLPNTSYYLQTAPTLAGPWTDAPAALTTDANGLITIPIAANPATPAQYYRVSTSP